MRHPPQVRIIAGEYVPLLVDGEPVKGGINLATRTSFSDVAASLADFFGVNLKTGISFVPEILNNPKD